MGSCTTLLPIENLRNLDYENHDYRSTGTFASLSSSPSLPSSCRGHSRGEFMAMSLPLKRTAARAGGREGGHQGNYINRLLHHNHNNNTANTNREGTISRSNENEEDRMEVDENDVTVNSSTQQQVKHLIRSNRAKRRGSLLQSLSKIPTIRGLSGQTASNGTAATSSSSTSGPTHSSPSSPNNSGHNRANYNRSTNSDINHSSQQSTRQDPVRRGKSRSPSPTKNKRARSRSTRRSSTSGAKKQNILQDNQMPPPPPTTQTISPNEQDSNPAAEEQETGREIRTSSPGKSRRSSMGPLGAIRQNFRGRVVGVHRAAAATNGESGSSDEASGRGTTPEPKSRRSSLGPIGLIRQNFRGGSNAAAAATTSTDPGVSSTNVKTEMKTETLSSVPRRASLPHRPMEENPSTVVGLKNQADSIGVESPKESNRNSSSSNKKSNNSREINSEKRTRRSSTGALPTAQSKVKSSIRPESPRKSPKKERVSRGKNTSSTQENHHRQKSQHSSPVSPQPAPPTTRRSSVGPSRRASMGHSNSEDDFSLYSNILHGWPSGTAASPSVYSNLDAFNHIADPLNPSTAETTSYSAAAVSTKGEKPLYYIVRTESSDKTKNIENAKSNNSASPSVSTRRSSMGSIPQGNNSVSGKDKAKGKDSQSHTHSRRSSIGSSVAAMKQNFRNPSSAANHEDFSNVASPRPDRSSLGPIQALKQNFRGLPLSNSPFSSPHTIEEEQHVTETSQSHSPQSIAASPTKTSRRASLGPVGAAMTRKSSFRGGSTGTGGSRVTPSASTSTFMGQEKPTHQIISSVSNSSASSSTYRPHELKPTYTIISNASTSSHSSSSPQHSHTQVNHKTRRSSTGPITAIMSGGNNYCYDNQHQPSRRLSMGSNADALRQTYRGGSSASANPSANNTLPKRLSMGPITSILAGSSISAEARDKESRIGEKSMYPDGIHSRDKENHAYRRQKRRSSYHGFLGKEETKGSDGRKEGSICSNDSSNNKSLPNNPRQARRLSVNGFMGRDETKRKDIYGYEGVDSTRTDNNISQAHPRQTRRLSFNGFTGKEESRGKEGHCQVSGNDHVNAQHHPRQPRRLSFNGLMGGTENGHGSELGSHPRQTRRLSFGGASAAAAAATSSSSLSDQDDEDHHHYYNEYPQEQTRVRRRNSLSSAWSNTKNFLSSSPANTAEMQLTLHQQQQQQERQLNQLLSNVHDAMTELTNRETESRKTIRVHLDRAKARYVCGNATGAILSMKKVKRLQAYQAKVLDSLGEMRNIETEVSGMQQSLSPAVSNVTTTTGFSHAPMAIELPGFGNTLASIQRHLNRIVEGAVAAAASVSTSGSIDGETASISGESFFSNSTSSTFAAQKRGSLHHDTQSYSSNRERCLALLRELTCLLGQPGVAPGGVKERYCII